MVECRNAVAHFAYRAYVTGRGNRGDRAVAEWADWFVTQSEQLGRAYNGVVSVTAALRPEELDDEGLTTVWRRWVADPVERLSYPAVAAD